MISLTRSNVSISLSINSASPVDWNISQSDFLDLSVWMCADTSFFMEISSSMDFVSRSIPRILSVII